MQTGVIILSVLAGFLLAAIIFLAMFGKQLIERSERRARIKGSVRQVGSWCYRIWEGLGELTSAERRRINIDPLARTVIGTLLNEAVRINDEALSTVRDALSMPLDDAENAVIRLFPIVRELESVTRDISSVDGSVHGLRERVVSLLDSTEAYRQSIAARIENLRDKGISLGRERKLVIGFGNLIEAYRTHIDSGAVDMLYRLSGLLVVLNTVAGQVFAAESGRRVRWRSYTKDSIPLKESVDVKVLADRVSRKDVKGIRFMTDLMATQTEKMGRIADKLAMVAIAATPRLAAFAAARELQKQAAYTRVCIREFMKG